MQVLLEESPLVLVEDLLNSVGGNKPSVVS